MGRAGAGPNRSALIVSPGPTPGHPPGVALEALIEACASAKQASRQGWPYYTRRWRGSQSRACRTDAWRSVRSFAPRANGGAGWGWAYIVGPPLAAGLGRAG